MTSEIIAELNRFYNEGIISYLQLDYMTKQLSASERQAQQQAAADSATPTQEQPAQTQTQATEQEKWDAYREHHYRYSAEEPVPPERKPINVQKLTFAIIGIIAAVLIGSAIVNFIAANWLTMSVELKMVFAGVVVLSACAVGVIAFCKDHFVWMEGAAIYAFATSIAVSAIISQALQSQTDEAAFLRILLPVAVLITIGFNSRILYVVTSMLFIACSVANDYRMWWIIAVWVIFHIVKSLLEKDKSPYFVLSVVVQAIILTFGFTHSFIEDPIIVASLLCVTAFLYDRVWIIYKRRQSIDYPDKTNAFRVIGIIIFFVTVGPVFNASFDTSKPYWLVSLPMLASYLAVAAFTPETGQSSFNINVGKRTVAFPIMGFIPLSVTLGMVLAHVHPVAGALAAIIPVIVALLYFGSSLSNNGYLIFGIGLTVYLSALTVFLTEGAFMTRAIFGAVTGAILLLLNWGIRKYVNR